MDVSLGKKLMS